MRKPRCPSSIDFISVGSEAQKTNKVRKQQSKNCMQLFWVLFITNHDIFPIVVAVTNSHYLK